ncbi:uncharacterized protein LOC118411085 [Branchiostoma floridae]|uniref:Uncharacterized protein LOC118411085 n=1 Tax=Branchiostoma floridae TaxID=7739 RepID=A0A9J7MIZ8_BRAFL|nr:uncharacterized protein LOC118411085 [Branchiostoma floridae]
MSLPVTNLLDSPVGARYVRFVVQTWNDRIAMRVEIVGCNTSTFNDKYFIANAFKLIQQVDLGEMKRVMGTIAQGRLSHDHQWVTSYKLLYSTDRITWMTYTDINGSEIVFPGNADVSLPVTNLLDSPVDARYVRFVVQSWHNRIAMRVEIVGCNTTAAPLPACPQPLGMESGDIPHGSITASSTSARGLEPFRARLNGGAAWAAGYNTIGQWLQVFPGNVDISIPVTNLLNSPVDARYVRFLVQSWHNHISMRGEIVGCNTTAVQPVCPQTLGMESGAIPGGSITASSYYRGRRTVYVEPYQARLNGRRAWKAFYNLIGQWLQVFPGNIDMILPVTNLLDKPVDARYVRFVVQSWHNGIAMRVEIVGCNTTAVQPVCPQSLGMESGAIPGIIASSTYTRGGRSVGLEPAYARLNGGRAWKAGYNLIGQWLQVFPANVDMSIPVTNLLDNPVDARHVRFVVQSWNNHISMRVEIVGCNTTAVAPVCPYLLGMESGAIPDGSITASSFHRESSSSYGLEPRYGRLNVAPTRAWTAKYNLVGQWLQVFPGNVDMSLPVTNILNNPVDARYVRFVVLSWNDRIAMRVEIVGCNTIDARYVRFVVQSWHTRIAMRVEIVGCNTSKFQSG